MVFYKDEITALQIFYSQPYRRRELDEVDQDANIVGEGRFCEEIVYKVSRIDGSERTTIIRNMSYF